MSKMDQSANHQVSSILIRANTVLNSILDANIGYFCIVDRQGSVLRANENLAMIGFSSPEDVLNLKLGQLVGESAWQTIERGIVGLDSEHAVAQVRTDLQRGSELIRIDWRVSRFSVASRFSSTGNSTQELYSLAGSDATAMGRLESKMENIINHLPVGIVSCDRTWRVLSGFSPLCGRYFDANFKEGSHFIQLVWSHLDSTDLSEKQRASIDQLLNESPISNSAIEAAIQDFPKRLRIKSAKEAGVTHHLDIQFQLDANLLDPEITIFLIDQTQLVLTQEKVANLKALEDREVKRIIEIKSVGPDLIKIILPEVENLFLRCSDSFLKQDWQDLKRNLHALKGNSRITGLKTVSQAAMMAEEELLKVASSERTEFIKVRLLAIQNELEQVRSMAEALYQFTAADQIQETVATADPMAGKLKSVAADFRKTYAFLGRTGASLIKDRLAMIMMVFNFKRVADFVPLFEKQVNQLSKELGKSVALEVSGSEFHLDPSIETLFFDTVEHLIKNSMIHGIEDSVVRKLNGKPERGVIRLECEYSSGRFQWAVIDDGRGISLSTLKMRALDLQLATSTKLRTYTEKETLELMFLREYSTLIAKPGESKMTKAKEHGIGLAAIREELEAKKGKIEVNTKFAEGSSFFAHVPAPFLKLNSKLWPGEVAYAKFSAAFEDLNHESKRIFLFANQVELNSLIIYADLEKLVLALHVYAGQIYCHSKVVVKIGVDDSKRRISFHFTQTQMDTRFDNFQFIALREIAGDIMQQHGVNISAESDDNFTISFDIIVDCRRLPNLAVALRNQDPDTSVVAKEIHRLQKKFGLPIANLNSVEPADVSLIGLETNEEVLNKIFDAFNSKIAS